jgi:hypothetical protein
MSKFAALQIKKKGLVRVSVGCLKNLKAHKKSRIT